MTWAIAIIAIAGWALLLTFVIGACCLSGAADDASDEITRQLANGEAPSPTNFHNLHDTANSLRG